MATATDNTARIDPKTLAALRDFKSRLERRFGERLKGVYLFGSRARGDHHDESDADVAILVRDGEPVDRQATWDVIPDATDVMLTWGVYVQPWVLPESALQNPDAHRAPHMIHAILRDGFRV